MFDRIPQGSSIPAPHSYPAQEERRSMRHRGLKAEAVLDGYNLEIIDWSLAGVLLAPVPGVPRPGVGEELKLTLRFHLLHETVGFWIDGRVIRSGLDGVAVEFGPLTSYAERKFARVIDGYHAQMFAESQKNAML